MATQMMMTDVDPRLGKAASDFLRRGPKMLIDGRLVSALSGKSMPVFNPATGRILLEVPEGERKISMLRLGPHAVHSMMEAGQR